MTRTFSVINFEKFQHYRDRSPPWIKLYNGLLDDYAFGQLPDASKLHLVAIWLLASRFDNRVPHDPQWIAKRINASQPVDLGLLAAKGFITVHEGSDPLAACAQDDAPESESETDEETEKDSSADADASAPSSKPGRKAYPEEFEAFWRAYPTDALMSKLKAFEKWRRLSAEDRAAAMRAVPGFRAHCAKDSTYRPVHAERFLSQRRFDGFNEQEVKQSGAAPVNDDAALKAEWGGHALALVEAIGAAKFQAWFSGSAFSVGPPATITVEKPFAAEWITRHFMSELRRLFGEIRVEVKHV